MGAKILIGVGTALTLLCGLVLLISLALPVVSNGKTNWEEAMLGIVPSAICGFLSFLLLVGGVVWLTMSRRKS
jgi:hypothetical protein